MRLRTHQVVVSALVLAAGTWAANAGVVDLTTANASGQIGSVLFQNFHITPAGSGNLNSFVRIGGNESVVHGYNTSGRGSNFNSFNINSSPIFTRDLTYGEIPTTIIGGVSYREFLLDINQTNANPLLTLSQVAIFTSMSGGITPALNGVYAGFGNLIWEMNAGLEHDGSASMATPSSRVEMNYSLQAGSGQADMYMYVPESLFAGVLASDFVYLYSIFGSPEGNNDGFEEWAVRGVSPVIPLPNIAGLGLAGLGMIAVRRTRRA
jgi:MYXO-CTERM domain-containing protein